MTFSNPRLYAEFSDWPLGGNKRGVCVFSVEYRKGKGWRVLRTTTGKPKVHTYGGKLAIVDGSDGRTYVLQEAGSFDAVAIIQSDLKYSKYVYATDPSLAELKELIAQADTPNEAADGDSLRTIQNDLSH